MSDLNNKIMDKATNHGLLRKKFLKYAGTSAATLFAFGLAACNDDNPMGMDNLRSFLAIPFSLLYIP